MSAPGRLSGRQLDIGVIAVARFFRNNSAASGPHGRFLRFEVREDVQEILAEGTGIVSRHCELRSFRRARCREGSQVRSARLRKGRACCRRRAEQGPLSSVCHHACGVFRDRDSSTIAPVRRWRGARIRKTATDVTSPHLQVHNAILATNLEARNRWARHQHMGRRDGLAHSAWRFGTKFLNCFGGIFGKDSGRIRMLFKRYSILSRLGTRF